MTRETRGQAGAPGVDARLQAARESSATVFIGLSVAASGLEGLEVLVMPTTGVTPAVAAASGPLADAVFASLRVENSAVSTITATADKVMAGAGTAGVGVQLGSFGAKTDRKLFGSTAWADTMARAIGRALTALYGSTP
jgi:N-acetylmuramoyl-L-alanine amidase